MRKRHQVGDDRALVVAQSDGQREMSEEELPRPRFQNLAECNGVGERRARILLRDFLRHDLAPVFAAPAERRRDAARSCASRNCIARDHPREHCELYHIARMKC